MLTRRVHTLFEEEEFRELITQAVEAEKSVGEMIRLAVRRVYIEPKDREQINRDQAFVALKKLQEKTKQKGRVDYKALIEYGRKY